MAMTKSAAILGLLFVRGSFSASIESCGAAGDHLSNVKVSLSPDPIEKGQPFSLVLSGDLDDILEAGVVSVDLQIEALRIINKKVSASSPISISPGIAKGAQSISVGPVSLPTNIPGSAVVSGKVHVTNAKGEPVACLSLDLNVPALEGEDSNARVADPEASSCGQASDHLKNLNVASSGNVTTITGDLDESVTKLSVGVDIKLEWSFFHIPIQMTIPISYSPGIPKGSLKITAGPPTQQMEREELEVGMPVITVVGQVKINDDKSEEIACIDVAKSSDVSDQKTLLV